VIFVTEIESRSANGSDTIAKGLKTGRLRTVQSKPFRIMGCQLVMVHDLLRVRVHMIQVRAVQNLKIPIIFTVGPFGSDPQIKAV
jgi:hypothetical protein